MHELEPVANNWDWFNALLGPSDEDFASAAAEKPKEQARSALDFFG